MYHRILPEHLQDDRSLPLKRATHVPMLYNSLDWRFLPKMDLKWRNFFLKCISCTKKEYKQSWPVNWTTLAQHHKSVHNSSLNEMRARDFKNEAENLGEKEGDTNY